MAIQWTIQTVPCKVNLQFSVAIIFLFVCINFDDTIYFAFICSLSAANVLFVSLHCKYTRVHFQLIWKYWSECDTAEFIVCSVQSGRVWVVIGPPILDFPRKWIKSMKNCTKKMTRCKIEPGQSSLLRWLWLLLDQNAKTLKIDCRHHFHLLFLLPSEFSDLF